MYFSDSQSVLGNDIDGLLDVNENHGFPKKDGNFLIKKALISLLQSALAIRKCIWGCPQTKLIYRFLLLRMEAILNYVIRMYENNNFS